MRPATQVVKMKPPISDTIDKINCHVGTPNPILPIIAMGEVKGMMESQMLIDPCGSSRIKVNKPKYAINIGIVMGNINC